MLEIIGKIESKARMPSWKLCERLLETWLIYLEIDGLANFNGTTFPSSMN